MLVKTWMSEPVITLEEEEPLIKAFQILKEFKIRRIPITKNGKLTGIITHTDIKAATPPKLGIPEFDEFFEMFSQLKVKDVMTRDPITVYPEDTIEKASILMLENKISGLPVINPNKYVVGIITQTDIFKLFVNITGAYYSPYQITLFIDSTEEIVEILEVFKKFNIVIYSLLQWKDEFCYDSPCRRKVFVRFHGVDEKTLDELKSLLAEKFEILSFKKEDIRNIPKKKTSSKDEEEISLFY
ncbi:MAG: CBS domain-containing protein [Thermodesulfobacteria bacterium]|nr:CBS domain-containing protein [Thermodesulfobacteriota bacterium]